MVRFEKVKEVGPEAYPEDKNNLTFFVYEKERV